MSAKGFQIAVHRQFAPNEISLMTQLLLRFVGPVVEQAELFSREGFSIIAVAHAEDADLRGQMDILDYLGNLVADIAAGIIADDELNTVLEEDVSQWQGIAYQVADRISLLEKECWDKDPKEILLEDDVDVPEDTVRQHMNNIIAQVGERDHELITKGRFITCAKCAIRVCIQDMHGQIRAKALSGFAKQHCNPKGTHATLQPMGPQPLLNPCQN